MVSLSTKQGAGIHLATLAMGTIEAICDQPKSRLISVFNFSNSS
jgi:hypothetical protein